MFLPRMMPFCAISYKFPLPGSQCTCRKAANARALNAGPCKVRLPGRSSAQRRNTCTDTSPSVPAHPWRSVETLTAIPSLLPCPTFPPNAPSSWGTAAASCMFALCAGTWSGRPSMTMVWRVGSKDAADTPKLPRMVSSSAAAACAAAGMRSVPGVGVSNSPARWYNAAAVVHLAAAGASGSGTARPTRCRSAVAAIQAGGGCWGGRGAPRNGRGRRAAIASGALVRADLMSRLRVHGQPHVSQRSSR